MLSHFDLPGYGKSKNINMDRIEFIKFITGRLSNNRNFVLFGVSYGGLITIRYALKYPNRVKGLIIGGMPYYFGFSKTLNLVRFLTFLPIARIIGEFVFLNKDNLSKLKIPVLLLYSKADHHATPKMARALERLIPDSHLFVIKGLNHSWLMHRIDKSGFLEEIEKFIKGVV